MAVPLGPFGGGRLAPGRPIPAGGCQRNASSSHPLVTSPSRTAPCFPLFATSYRASQSSISPQSRSPSTPPALPSCHPPPSRPVQPAACLGLLRRQHYKYSPLKPLRPSVRPPHPASSRLQLPLSVNLLYNYHLIYTCNPPAINHPRNCQLSCYNLQRSASHPSCLLPYCLYIIPGTTNSHPLDLCTACHNPYIPGDPPGISIITSRILYVFFEAQVPA
ncbi:hypothetical protein PtA15_15A477 [Puccinia triticina]|uniref:Uncharacterized protein n=1 Tax=Puccinia triticina TaxID=208348 RepID=A0ABY7D6W9_9BASI|nr:uncharacterized protein PtA15_15A477 [Puccinia triticina]WAQ92081.1 hypothetical protein PtA15_15A477 [Puccinia triticina]